MLSSNHVKEMQEKVTSDQLVQQLLNYIQGLELTIILEGFNNELAAFKTWLDGIYATYNDMPREKFNQLVHQALFSFYLKDLKTKVVSDQVQISLQLQTQIKDVEKLLKEGWVLHFGEKAKRCNKIKKVESLSMILIMIGMMRLTFMTNNTVSSFWPDLTDVVTVGGYSTFESIVVLLSLFTWFSTMWYNTHWTNIPKQPETVVFNNNFDFHGDLWKVFSCNIPSDFDSEIFQLVKPPLQTFFDSLPQPAQRAADDKKEDEPDYKLLPGF